MLKTLKTFFLMLLILMLSASCSGRLPSPKTARAVSMSFFKKYGNTYPTSQIGRKNLDNISINHIEEISYKFALVDVVMTLVDGHAGRALVHMEKKFPGGVAGCFVGNARLPIGPA